MKAGVPAYKLVIGSPYYSRGWKGVKNNGSMKSLPGLGATATGGAKGIWDGGRAAGINPYYYIKSQMENDSSFVKYRDPYTKTPYLYSQSKGEMYTYEDEVSIATKADYVNNNSLGGVIFWELSADFPSKGSTLTTVLFDKLLNGTHPRYVNAGVATNIQTNTVDVQTNPETNVDTNTNQDVQNVAEISSDTQAEIDAQTNLEVWNPNRVYFANDKVVLNGKVYVALWWTKGNIPGTEQWGPWKVDTTQETATANSTEESTVTTETNANIDVNTTVQETVNAEESIIIEGAYPQWNEAETYLSGDLVIYDGTIYQAQWWSLNNTPRNEKYTPWKKIGAPANNTQTDENTTTTVEDVNATASTTTGSSVYTLTRAELLAKEKSLTSSELMKSVKKSIQTLDNKEVEKIKALRSANSRNKCNFLKVS